MFEFEIIFKIPESFDTVDDCVDALFEAGCDDGVIGTGEEGMITIDFSIDASEIDSPMHAISDARRRVEKAVGNISMTIKQTHN